MTWHALVVLPAHIDGSRAGTIGEDLHSAINHHPSVLIADMTATVSCDHNGAEAMIGAYRRAIETGTQFRLVVPALSVRNILRLSGLGHIVPMYTSVSLAADGDQGPDETPAMVQAPTRELLDRIVRNLVLAGLSLQAVETPKMVDRRCLTEALQHLDETIREIRDHVLASQGRLLPGGA